MIIKVYNYVIIYFDVWELTIKFLVDVESLMLSLTVDDHENRLGLVEQEVG